ncbi:alpha-L-rhamnosidase C-terminal domain-containing protein [Mucilaginibacter sp. Mucisp84]|uniref:alpha-L-rhamnosidase-related protein n=1 Tax=Mucilaginibacter sp. Mucisp84 TaxID=3243058 RepID=UPI0039A4E97C
MKHLLILTLSLTIILSSQNSNAQPVHKTAEERTWNAQWISVPNITGNEYGIYYFRKNIELTNKPASFVIHVSADNRYKLYVNGTLVSLGPARGDTFYWNYETVDLAPYLVTGKNTVAALVWNEAQYRPEAQISVRTAFIIQGNSVAEEILNTNNTWKSIQDKGYQPIWGYFAASTGEMVDLNKSMMNWYSPNFDDSSWPKAANLFGGQLKGRWDGFGWQLVPSSIPHQELIYERIPVVRKASGIDVPPVFPGTKTPLTIPANTTVTMLLDQTHLTNAYPTINFSGGKDAGISLSYAESLFDNLSKYGMRKGNRNDVEDKDFSGRNDSLISNGSKGQSYTTLNFRTFRYIRLIVHTQNEPLVIDDLYGTFTGYPFKQRAVFNTDNKEIKQMLDIGWRTARLNAFETYTDCPYYEQLQYIGDTRIQAMISYYYSGDDRLARNAINLMDHSRLTEGVTQSRYPTHDTQIISTFSLWYIGMLYDYWMYRNDSNFIKDKLDGERAVLKFFSQYQQADGSLKNTPYWTFVDWASGKNWDIGSPPKGTDGSSAIIDLQLLWAYEWAAAMETKMGMPGYATLYNKEAAKLKQTIQRKYWDPAKMLYADTWDKKQFSQHANSLAILTGMVKNADLPVLSKRLLSDTSLTQCTIYFKYYLHQALVKGGLGNDYMNWLDIWRENIKMGLTTWAEYSDLKYSRSDCHAWGSSPNIEFFRTVLGIDSYSPGFSKIRIEPHLGTMTNVSGEIPHPDGKVAVAYVLENNRWKIKVSLPQHTSGILVWRAKTYLLKSGENVMII